MKERATEEMKKRRPIKIELGLLRALTFSQKEEPVNLYTKTQILTYYLLNAKKQ